MPELTKTKGKRNHQAGSALVSVVAISTLLTLAIGGFFGIARNGISQEILSLNDDQVFLAAESGLILGSKWVLTQKASWPQNTEYPDIFGPAFRGSNAINGMDVTVAVSFQGKTVIVTSVAQHPTDPSLTRSISHEMVQAPMTSGEFGIYLINAYQLGGNTQGIRRVEFDGPAHFNTALKMGNPGGGNENRFSDRVSLFNIDPGTNQPVANLLNPIGHFNNDYRYGVMGGSNDWDNEFRNRYDPYADRVLPIFDTMSTTEIFLNGSDIALTFGNNNGGPYFQYTTPAGDVQTINYDPDRELKLRIVNSEAAVSGSVTGKVSLYTDPGKNIRLPGDLTYADFSPDNFANPDTAGNSGYGFESRNVLGLYSGGDFIVPEGTHYITGQLFSVEQTTATIVFEADQKNKTFFNLFGTLATSVFWDPKQGNDQASFKQIWDRRNLSAPGLGFERVDYAGNQIVIAAYSNWVEAIGPSN